MNPSIRQLEAFALVYELGTISKAAERMYISQSAVSVMLRQLETTLDTKLFDRTTRSLQPTAAAKEAIVSVNRMRLEMTSLTNSMKGLADKSYGTVNLGVGVAFAASIFPKILKEFTEQYPNVTVVARDVPHEQLIKLLHDHEVEFVIGGPPGSTEQELLYRDVTDYPMSAIDLGQVGDDSETVKWADVLNGPTIAISHGGIRDQIDKKLHEYGLEFNPTFEVELLPTALAMTAGGLGVSILPGILCPSDIYPAFRVRSLCEPLVRRQVNVISRKDRSLSAAAEALVSLAIQRIREDFPEGVYSEVPEDGAPT